MLGFTVTRLRAARRESPYAKGPSSGTVSDWESPERKEFNNVVIAPTSSVTNYGTIGAPVVSGISLLFPGQVGLDISPRDRFEVRGEQWLVHGDKQEYVSPFTGYVGGTVVHLRQEANG